MSTLAWLMGLVAILIIRQVSKGRVMNIGEDLSDSFLAIISGKTDQLTEVLSRTGDSATPSTSVDAPTDGSTPSVGAGGFAGIAMALGKAAKGYRFGATGPEYYDCSGLMVATAKKLGYTGGRFTTFTIGTNKAFVKIASPAVQGPGTSGGTIGAGINDIVVWPTHHMGVITGPNKFYSARNPTSGIGETTISGFRSEAPVYYRYKG
jgi:cell wall-associated NlpC family hydrolase